MTLLGGIYLLYTTHLNGIEMGSRKIRTLNSLETKNFGYLNSMAKINPKIKMFENFGKHVPH